MKKVILLILIALPLFANAQFVKISQKQIDLESPSFTGIPEAPDLSGSNPNQVVNRASLLGALSTKISTTGDENFSGVKIASNSSEPNTAGLLLNNNFNGGVSSHTNAPFRIENNQNGIGAHIWNKTSGIATYYLGYGSGTLTYYNRSSSSTGDYISLNVEGVNISKLDYLGNFRTDGKIVWGSGSYEGGLSQIYNNPISGSVFVGKIGSSNDYQLINGSGQGVLRNPTGTQNIVVEGTATASPATVGTELVTLDQLNAVAGSSGTYTPTITSGTNVTSVTAPYSHTYSKVGNIVTVYGFSVPVLTNTAIDSDYTITLPFARATGATRVIGFGSTDQAPSTELRNVSINSETTTTAVIRLTNTVTGGVALRYSFQYDITQ